MCAAKCSDDIIAKMKRACEQHLKTWSSSAKTEKRELQVKLATVMLSSNVRAGRTEYEMQLMAAIKSEAPGKINGLPLLPHERLMIPKDAIDENAECEELLPSDSALELVIWLALKLVVHVCDVRSLE